MKFNFSGSLSVKWFVHSKRKGQSGDEELKERGTERTEKRGSWRKKSSFVEGHIYHVLASYLRTVNAAIWRAGVRGMLTRTKSTRCKREKDKKKKETQWEQTPHGYQRVINKLSTAGKEVCAGWIPSSSFFDEPVYSILIGSTVVSDKHLLKLSMWVTAENKRAIIRLIWSFQWFIWLVRICYCGLIGSTCVLQ